MRSFLLLVVITSVVSLSACSAEGFTTESADERTVAGAHQARLLSVAATPPDSDARYIVVLKSTVVNAKERAQGLAAKHAKSTHHIYSRALRGFAATLSPESALALSKNSDVWYIEEDRRADVGSVNNSPGWGLDRIDQRYGPRNGQFANTYDGTGITVYIVDSGVNAFHSDFGGRVTSGFTTDAIPANNPCNDHGTAVAGVLAGSSFGVATNATIVPVKGTRDCDGWGWVSSWNAAIDWVISHHTSGPAVMNMSVSTKNFYDDISPGSMNDAVKNAWRDGIFVVVSAGNSNSPACDYSPANATDVITVGATNIDDQIASFSNWGTCIDLFAPGEQIQTTGLVSGSFTTKSGTSFSAPFVAGVAALLLQRFPGDTPMQIRDMILNGATPAVIFPNGNGGASPNKLLFSNLPSAPSVSIDGRGYVGWSNSLCRWDAVITGGRAPFTFQWTGLKTGSQSSIFGPLFTSGAFYLEIWDSLGQHAVATPFFVHVDSAEPHYTLCTGGAE